ncbi:MAG: deoxyribose-phosphate aldolase [Chloroflexota bacterium]
MSDRMNVVAQAAAWLAGYQPQALPSPTRQRAAAELAALIDHTLLKPEATATMVAQLCAEARQHSFASVCVNSANAEQCARALRGSPVRVCSVVGFPLGASLSGAKADEAERCIALGASEIDMVLNVGALKGGDCDLARDDMAAVARACHARQALLKVILETCLLTEVEKVAACLLAAQAGVDFVKTSTGFYAAGATLEDVALMRAVVGPRMGVKAAGGIRTYAAACAMVAAGASRIGASASVAIVQSAPGAP